jgi:MoxR-like ATPase
MDDKLIFNGSGKPHDRIKSLAEPPPWRQFTASARHARGEKFRPDERAVEMVNAALYLRRPLLVTGKPGTGKSSLAYAVAHELQLGRVLLWSITTRSTLQQGLYSYDAIARLQDASLAKSGAGGDEGATGAAPQIGRYIRLGPLGTAMLPARPDESDHLRPRVLLIDEIDKSDIDLPNDLLNIFEEGEFDIPELSRLPEEERLADQGVFTYDREEQVRIESGHVRCNVFPFVVMTSNGEREFPPAFLRRCLRLDLEPHSTEVLTQIVEDRLAPSPEKREQVQALIREFVELRDNKELELSADQLLNAIYLVMQGLDPAKQGELRRGIFRSLSDSQ